VSRSFRYSLILVLVALGTGLAAVAGWRYARMSSPVSGPIVLISIDALRTDRLTPYGATRVATPAIAALAADGVTFEHAYTHAPQTLPAHTSLLSGRLPFDTGVRDNVSAVVPETTRLLSQLLRDRGYATGGVVSSFALRRETGLASGFAFFDDEMPEARGGPPLPVHRDGHESETRAERWLSAVATSRAFLFLHLAEPHAPYTPPARFSALEPYDGEVAYADEIVGKLVAYLKTQQLYDQATIILVGAQGESLGAHGEREHGLLLYDDTIRVPLIIKAPASEPAGRRVTALVQHVDIVPTVLDLAKAPIPDSLPGRSLKPLLEGRTLPERVAYAESLFARHQFGWSPLTTVTDGRFRYIDGPVPILYDTEADAAATLDATATQRDAAARLAEALRAFAPADDAPPADMEDLEPADRERFLALGFLGPRAWTPNLKVDATIDPGQHAATIESYRAAMRQVGQHKWDAGLEQLKAVAEKTPEFPELWASVAAVAERAERHDVAADAYRRLVAADATLVDARLALSRALLRTRRLDDARRQAELAAESADPPHRTRAHELLARIAVARRDPGSARAQAQQAAEADTSSPFPSFIEGRLLLDKGDYEAAVAQFDEAAAILTRAGGGPLEDLHLLRGDALTRLGRGEESEDAYLTELRNFPESTRALVSLATLYHAQQRHDEATAIVTRLTETVATAEAYEEAARLWTAFGDRERAAEIRGEAERELGTTPNATH
jgi:choline-sulfatase